ncbi:MAG: chaperone modulator CbpM [Bacteroidota bacterium]
MENKDLIPTVEFCECHQIEFSFINTLNEHGLIKITSIEEKKYLSCDQLKNIEKMIHMHYDLDINIEGIEAISHLLERVDLLHRELNILKNRLDFYKERG